MRYLKTYKLFESSRLDKYANEETDNLKETIKDILIELEDEGFKVQVSKMLPNNDQIMVRIFKNYVNDIKHEILYSTIDRVKDLMKEAGWYEVEEEPEHYAVDISLRYYKEKPKEYVTYGDGVAHTNF